MAAAKRVRWECPTGDHPGVLGPSKPRRDNLCRYCLPCSTSKGRLIERTAPAVERQRAAGKARSAAKQAAKRQRATRERAAAKDATTARYTVEGVDLRDEMTRYTRLRAFGGPTGKLARRPPTFDVTLRSTYPRARLGFAESWRNRIHVSIYPGISIIEARRTVLHELVHIHCGSGEGHGPRFKRLAREAFAEAGLSISGWATWSACDV